MGSFPAPGEIEGIDLTLSFLRDKRAEALRVQQREPIHLGLPAVGSWNLLPQNEVRRFRWVLNLCA